MSTIAIACKINPSILLPFPPCSYALSLNLSAMYNDSFIQRRPDVLAYFAFQWT